MLLFRRLDNVVHSALPQLLSCINMQQWWIYMNEWSSRIKCSVAECFPEKTSWCWNKQVCQECSAKHFERSQEQDTVQYK